MERIERWVILGDGLVTIEMIISNDNPPSSLEIMGKIHTQSAVITIYDAITGEILGMAYASLMHPELEEVRYYDVVPRRRDTGRNTK
jgi:hypothetical protein